MATTRQADVDPQIAEIWSNDLFSEAEDMVFWNRFFGDPGSSSPIIRRDDLEKGKGDTIHVDLVLALNGDGLTGDTSTLEGNEEKLNFRQQNVTVRSFTNGVAWTELSQLFITHNERDTAKNQLAKWLAGYIDDDIFREFTGNAKRDGTAATTIPTTAKIAAGTATTRNGIADTDAGGRLTLDAITELKAYAQVDRKIEPIRLDDGEEVFAMVVHPYAAMTLKKSSSWQTAVRDAGVRGGSNPLFTGALGMWDNVVLHTSNRVPRSANSGSVQVADNIFMGAQALSVAYAQYPDWREEVFDYGRRAGIATVCVKGEKLNVFDLTDAGGAAAADLSAIGSLLVYTAATGPSQP